jgi:predicted enzyme related to lactoylglutathione lyase
MTTRTTPFAAGTPCWVDLLTSDPEKSKQFFGDLLGWSFDQAGPEFGNYISCLSDGQMVAGMMGKNENSAPMPDAWTTYIATPDAAKSVDTATAAGASVFMAAQPIGDIGTMAVLADPAGGVFGLWQPGTHTGFGKYNEPGSVTWDEHHSKDFAATKRFYQSVFGWAYNDASDTDEFRYSTAQIDGQDVAGLMDSKAFLPPNVPTHWAVYFSSADVDASCAQAAKLGGTVVRPPEDTPFGRIADLLDSTGAGFKLHTDISGR